MMAACPTLNTGKIRAARMRAASAPSGTQASLKRACLNCLSLLLALALCMAIAGCGEESPVIYVPAQQGFDPDSGTPIGNEDELSIIEIGGVRLTFNFTRQKIVFANNNDTTARVRVRNELTGQIILDNQNLPRSTDVIAGLTFAPGDMIRVEVWQGLIQIGQSWIWPDNPDVAQDFIVGVE